MNYSLSDIEKIRTAALALADLEAAIASIKQQIDRLETIAEGEAALDPTLKNDKQRTYAAFQTLDADPAYATLQDEVKRLNHERATLLAELEYNRSQLSIRKLAQKARIANLLIGHEQADLAA